MILRSGVSRVKTMGQTFRILDDGKEVKNNGSVFRHKIQKGRRRLDGEGKALEGYKAKEKNEQSGYQGMKSSSWHWSCTGIKIRNMGEGHKGRPHTLKRGSNIEIRGTENCTIPKDVTGAN